MIREPKVAETEHELETNLVGVFPGQITSIEELRAPYTGSTYHEDQKLLIPRFHPYLVLGEEEGFLDWFGFDVNPVEHGPYQARTVTMPLIDAQAEIDQRFRRDWYVSLLVARTVVHDDHEGRWAVMRDTNRDVNQTAKTRENEINERTVHEAMLREIYGEDASYSLRTFSRITEDRRKFENRVWDAIERVGYLHTAIRALEGADATTQLTAKQRSLCRQMALDVTGRSYKIAERYRIFGHVDDFMMQAAPYFDQVREMHGQEAWEKAINAPK